MLYIATVCDRHWVTAHRAFTDRDKAIGWADRNFRACFSNPGLVETRAVENYEWYATYLEEGDHAYVVAVQPDDDSDL